MSIKLARVVEPCNNCSHFDICKYRFNCTKQVQSINKYIDELNKFLDPTEEDTEVKLTDIFAFGFSQGTTLPAIKSSCEYFSED